MTKLKHTQAKAQVNLWLSQLGRKNKLKLALDTEGRCTVDYKGTVGCCIEVPKGGDLLFFYSPLMPVPALHRSEISDILYQALCLNLFQIGTEGTTLSVDPSTDYFVLCYSQRIGNIGQEEFEDKVGHFLEAAATVTRLLEDIIQTTLNEQEG